MRIRTTAIGLMPEIEDNCIEDLAACKNTDVKGEVIENERHKMHFSIKSSQEAVVK